MMRDLEDLDATWTLLEARADAYPLAELDAGRPPARRRHRAGLAVAVGGGIAVAATIAVIASVLTRPAADQRHIVAPQSGHPVSVAVAHHRHLHARHHVATTQDWSTLPNDGHYLFVFDKMPGVTVTSLIGVGNPIDPGTDPAYQEVQTTGPEGGLVFKVNPTGGWQPEGGTPVTVNGTQGYYGSFLLHPEIPGHPVHPRVALAWQYAPNSWVTVASTSEDPIPLDKAQRIAGLVTVGEGDLIPNPPPPGD